MRKRPNIIFLMTDQQRYDGIGYVNNEVKTPNLDKLCRDGILYRETVCNAPMCVPSRYSMMTGLYPSQCGVRHNNQICINDEELELPVLPMRLNDAGYQTAGFGKTHWYKYFNSIDSRQTNSTRGFEKRVLGVSTRFNHEPGAYTMTEDDPTSFFKLKNETKDYGPGEEGYLGYRGCVSEMNEFEHYEGWLTKQTLKFLDEERDEERPLFLYLSFISPHAGLNVPKKYIDMYDIDNISDMDIGTNSPTMHYNSHPHTREGFLSCREEERKMTKLRYYGLCSFVDDMFGMVINKLKELGELDNSYIIFTSDHGDMIGNRNLTFSKYCLYEGSVRVPLVISGKRIDELDKSDEENRLVELVDLVPTILDIASMDQVLSLPGENLFEKTKRKGQFSEMHGGGGKNQHAPAYMYRTEKYKLIIYFDGLFKDADFDRKSVKGELFDLENDPIEFNNLYYDESYSETVNELILKLLVQQMLTNSKYPFKGTTTKLY